MTASTTFGLYADVARRDPAKARRYQRSIPAVLARPNVHQLERDRLTDALAGIASVLDPSTTCKRCGIVLSDPESIARGYGPDCAERMAVSA